MEASNKIKLDSACQHALTFTFLRVCIRNFHPTQETNIATPAMQFLVEKAVGKDTLALRVNYVIFYGFLRVFYGDFTGFLRLWVHLRVFYTQKPGFWTCHLRADSHQMHCGIPARTGKSNRGVCADTSQDLQIGISLKEMLFHLLHCGLTHGCHVDQFLFTFQFPIRGHPSTNHVMSCLILPLVGQQTQRADPSTRSKNSCSIL